MRVFRRGVAAVTAALTALTARVTTLEQEGGGSGGSAAIKRTASNQILTYTNDFAVQPADIQLSSLTGQNLNGSPFVWNNNRLEQNDTGGNSHVAALSGLPLSTAGASVEIAFDVTLNADPSGLRHFGLFLQSEDSARMTGYRVAHINSNWVISKFTDAFENNMQNGGTYVNQPFDTGTTKRVIFKLDTASGVGSLWVDGVKLGDFQDNTYSTLRPGLFSYGSSVAWDNLSYSGGFGKVIGLPNGYLLGGTTRAYSGGIVAAGRAVQIFDETGVQRAGLLPITGSIYTFTP